MYVLVIHQFFGFPSEVFYQHCFCVYDRTQKIDYNQAMRFQHAYVDCSLCY
ncbi:hypothetical protein M758_UG268600 [Ceratodon purpureus]|nr:hypothetical protein M758_UG268600 [Ceratodon purpureus]